MDPMDIVGKSKEDASLPKGSVSFPSLDRSLYYLIFGSVNFCVKLNRFCKPRIMQSML